MSDKAETLPASPGKLLFDVNEAAQRLSISVVSVRKLIRARRIRRIPDFRKILISDAELRKFAASAGQN
jgi:excisionase family DNA binding protein